MTDKFDEQAERLLPCECDGFLYVDGVAMKAHTILCPAYYRLIVAAALREMGTGLAAACAREADAEQQLAQAQVKIERLQLQIKDWEATLKAISDCVMEMKDKDTALRSQLAEARILLEEGAYFIGGDWRDRRDDWLAANREGGK